MVLYQTNFFLHSGDLSTLLTTKVSLCRIYGRQTGTGKYHSSSNFIFLCQYHSANSLYSSPFSGYSFQNCKREKLENFLRKRYYFEKHIFPPFEGQSILILFLLVSSLL